MREASKSLASLPEKTVNAVLTALADSLEEHTDAILRENAKDQKRIDSNNPKYDGLVLTSERIADIAKDLRSIVKLPSPLGKVLLERTLANGLRLSKVCVPIGVIGIIYEARPNVTVDSFALCFKSGNACALKGGSDAEHSNTILVQYIREILRKSKISEDVVTLLPVDRKAVKELLHSEGVVDLVIPRGSAELIAFVRKEASIPVIETGAGIVHIYLDSSADLKKATAIVLNAKTRKPSVCNAVDTLIVHETLLAKLGSIVDPLAEKKVQIFADKESYRALEKIYPEALLRHAKKEHFGTEFLSLKLSIKTVSNLEAALEHISNYSSKHSESIIAEDADVIDHFLESVDAAAVYANASTAFTDGAQFGLGAEIGVSTQKIHARGPMGLEELVSYKWVIRGNGQIRK